MIRKLHQFQQHLWEKKISYALFMHPDAAITYLTGMKPSYADLLITPKKAVLYLTKLDPKPSLPGIAIKPLTRNWFKMLSHKEKKIIGIRKDSLSVALLEQLKRHLPKAKWVDTSFLIEQLREEKTAEEIANIEKACTLTSNAFAALLRELPKRTLCTELDVALFLEREIRRQGGGIAFPTIVATGKNAATPHHITSPLPLKKGFLVIDFGASYNHYCADMSRTIFLGEPTTQEKEIYHLLLRAQQAAIDMVAEGASFMDLDKVARKKLGKYSKFFIHSLGHGIGLEVHEGSPFRQKKSVVQENQVFTVEPGIYLPGKAGIRVEDTIVFDGRPRVLTNAPKEFISIPWK